MADDIAYVIIGLLLLQALWRLPAALRGRSRERSLWGAFAALAAAWCMRNGAVREAVDGLGITDLSYLLKHTVAIIGICVLLKYASTVSCSADARSAGRGVRVTAAVHRIATKASAATILVMASVFIFVLRDPDRGTFFLVARYAGQPGLAVYLGLFNLYTAAAAAVCGYQWGSAARRARGGLQGRARRWSLTVGLVMMSVSMGLAVLYAVLRTTYLVIVTVRPVSDSVNLLQEQVTDGLLYAVFLLFAIGSIAPATHAGINRWRTMMTLNEIYPLWRELATAVPEVVLRQPRDKLPGWRASPLLNRLWDVMSLDTPPHLRLERYVTEISDANRTLSHYASKGLYARAMDLSERQHHAGDDSRAFADAYWMTSAIQAKKSGAPAHAAPVDSLPGIDDDFDSYLPRLLRARAAYRHVHPDTAAVLLRSAATT